MARTRLPRGLLLSVMRQKVGPQKTSTTSAQRASKGTPSPWPTPAGTVRTWPSPLAGRRQRALQRKTQPSRAERQVAPQGVTVARATLWVAVVQLADLSAKKVRPRAPPPGARLRRSLLAEDARFFESRLIQPKTRPGSSLCESSPAGKSYELYRVARAA